MDTYVVLKFVHVAAAIIWLGGGFTMLVLAHAQARRPNPHALVNVIAQVAYLGPRLFLPASLVTLLSGLAITVVGGYGWPAWVVLGLIGLAATALFGAVKLGPMSEGLVVAARTGGAASAMPAARRLLRLARLDYAVQFAIVLLMVAQPDWQDLVILAGVGTTVAVAALAAFQPWPRAARSA